ncbi:stage II sporulation protein M [Flammeovirga kamogawensis]|uniref:Stage II sporulation protein M n=1 Tax=Flammeovirga kamogawensis TaxID=373891 RepID=A0ABX8H415_9BACT|nr:stage II sporulation protein M [Flammeovirga kamogawensis]MBB6460501.1 putative membrane protein SpoIIM required for sporulation [Flammeovirga kamogawensis]QWG10307.1 stage II sporulation protein M [Flammeovirga kamogawensis]TRX64755.1 stage II sporulation protein M [Flammeovirga kamogawensis]
MKEPIFILKNQNKWQTIEQALNKPTVSPDLLASYYKSLSEDLSYAQTFYPESEVTFYLNGLSIKYHERIYTNKKEKTSRIRTFWIEEVPYEMARNRKQILYALAVFLVSCVIGVFSAHHDGEFVRLILGDGYVNMTLENIANGKPMDVYASGSEIEMFTYITLNNIKVSFLAFAFGIFSSFGTGVLLFRNGIMLGSFQYFFYQKGVLEASLLSIWTHGTLEITAIIFAGGAGFVLGNSLLFPKYKKRMDSVKEGTKSGLKIIIGLIPIFIIAGFLEGFVTRQVDWPLPIRLFFIITSFSFIIFYYFYHANKVFERRQV